MNHPGLDERLLVQWWSRVRCNRDAYAVSNLIDPNTGCEHSADYLDMMKLKGVLTRRGIAARRRAAFADEVPYPGDQNNGAFEDLEALLGGHQNLLFAPEGETNPWPSLKPLKSGIARVAMRCANRSCAKILIVPVAVHFIASGAYCRDAVLEFGEPICVLADTEDVWRCKLMDSVSKELRRMCDFVPYASNRLDPAPHHNGKFMHDTFMRTAYYAIQLRSK